MKNSYPEPKEGDKQPLGATKSNKYADIGKGTTPTGRYNDIGNIQLKCNTVDSVLAKDKTIEELIMQNRKLVNIIECINSKKGLPEFSKIKCPHCGKEIEVM